MPEQHSGRTTSRTCLGPVDFMGDFTKKIQDIRIASEYSLIRKLGEGGFGAVYLGKNLDTGNEVALKFEHRSVEPSFLEDEVEKYETFEGLAGFPKVYWYGWQDDYKIMAFELLGPSLEDLFRFCGNHFTLKTTLMIADQLLARFETLHSKGLIHRDIKPENFLLGTRKTGNVIYMTDFGLAKEFTRRVHPPKDDSVQRPHLVGTARYASINGHLGKAQSFSDDLEALGYIMVYFLRGRLPWQGLKAETGKDKYDLILKAKQGTDASELCSGLPGEFTEYMSSIRSLKDNERPNYERLRHLFRQVFHRERYDYDNIFDWTELIYQQRPNKNIRGKRRD